jgi:uncharacterized protein (DUF2147 family)
MAYRWNNSTALVWDGMVRLFVSLLLLLCAPAAHADPSSVAPNPVDQSPVGLWRLPDQGGVIAIAPCGEALCARIAGFFMDHPDDKTPVDFRGISQCNLTLIADARPIRPGLWKGHITNPRNGTVWGVEFHLDPHGNLALRGFLAVPLLGRTQIWTRYPDQLPIDCRIAAPAAVIGQRPVLPNLSGQAE